MSQGIEQVKQEDLKSRSSPSLSPLNTVTFVALLGVALAVTGNLLLVWLLHGVFVPEFFIAIVPALFLAGLVFRRVRWAPAAGAGIALLTVTFFLADANAQYALLHPGNSFVDFMAEVIVLAFALVTVVTGVGATMQNYRRCQPSRQQWLQPFLTGLVGIVVGMLIVSAITAANPVTNSASNISGEPTVHMTADNFAQNVVLVPKGSRLLLVDDASTEHILHNGIWTTNGTPRALVEPGAPNVQGLVIKGGSAQIGPFTTAGVFHIYCTIHRGMNLTIVVQ